MIIKDKIFLVVMLLASPLVIIAQEEFENNSLDASKLITKELLIRNNKVNIENSQSTNQYLQSNNLIQIKQIGNYNYSGVYVRSYEADVQVNQNGDNNYTIKFIKCLNKITNWNKVFYITKSLIR